MFRLFKHYVPHAVVWLALLVVYDSEATFKLPGFVRSRLRPAAAPTT